MQSFASKNYCLKTLLIMKLVFVLTVFFTLGAAAKGHAQKVSLAEKNQPLEKVFQAIRTQTGYDFIYSTSLLQQARPVSIDIKDGELKTVLDNLFEGQPFTYTVMDKTIIVKPKEIRNLPPPPPQAPAPVVNELHGRVTDSTGAPLANASVIIKGTNHGTQTNADGKFTLKYTERNVTLVVAYTGYQTREYEVGAGNNVLIMLKASDNALENVIVNKGYYTTTQRLNTGDITKVTAKEIEDQPVSNPLAALEGRVPGLIITQTTGVPGGAFTVQLRGLNSIGSGTNPFIVVDGIPYNSSTPAPDQFAGNGASLNGNLNGGSPLNFINPSDIESIEVLKDADATAIYGSRAANGVILITTKKGRSGDMRVNVRAYSGFSTLAHDIDMMNTQQYLSMRHEAFKNDHASPGVSDYDLNGTWDSTRYTNWSKVLLDNTAIYSDAEASVSGGGLNSQYLIGGGYTRQSTGMPTLLPGDGFDQKASLHFNFNGSSPNKKFKITLTGSYVSDVNTTQSQNFSGKRLSLAPDAPPIYNADGTLNWAPLSAGRSGTWVNPYASLYLKYRGVTSNLIGNAIISYAIFRGLEFRTSLGYNFSETNEVLTNPTQSYDPGSHVTSGRSNFNTINTHSWIAEPQLEYKRRFGNGQFTALFGATFNESVNDTKWFLATGFVSDALLEDMQSATSVTSVISNTDYKYSAAFGRLSYNLQEKYLINLTARRDGSSRFGPGKQFANFGAAGLGWIFSSERFMQKSLPFISFGKLRASYGTTGNDQIGDYKFLDLYQVTMLSYNGNQGLYPGNLFNPNLAWELTKKLEVGIELGVLHDRINLQASWYKNRSDNQLLTTPLSLVTGFSSIAANLNASIQNTGFEFALNTVNIETKNFKWSTSFNISTWKNKLLSFNDLASSPYASNFVVGQPITIRQLLKFAGVNDTTGFYQFYTSKGDIVYKPNINTDRTQLVNPVPKYYGGLQNTISYKRVSLGFLVQFVKQTGTNFVNAWGISPGKLLNQPIFYIDDHWQQPGDMKTFQQYSRGVGQAATSFAYSAYSTFAYVDASFIRLKNVTLSYNLPNKWITRMKLTNFRVFAQAQNLFTITKYVGIDPESQGTGLPPLRTWAFGLDVSF